MQKIRNLSKWIFFLLGNIVILFLYSRNPRCITNNAAGIMYSHPGACLLQYKIFHELLVCYVRKVKKLDTQLKKIAHDIKKMLQPYLLCMEDLTLCFSTVSSLA